MANANPPASARHERAGRQSRPGIRGGRQSTGQAPRLRERAIDRCKRIISGAGEFLDAPASASDKRRQKITNLNAYNNYAYNLILQ
jgi:hypothetical protein